MVVSAATPDVAVAAVAPASAAVAVEVEDAAEASSPLELALGANWHPRVW